VSKRPAPARPGISMEAAQRRRARLAEQLRVGKMTRTLVTPEGAEIRLRLASVAERAGALFIDLAIQWAVMVAMWIAFAYVAAGIGFEQMHVVFAFLLVFHFVLRNFYFIFFEIGRKAATPGKRALGLRVASRDGGRLTADAVLARNFMREVEIGLPLQFLFMGGDQVGAWIALLGLAWSGVFMLFPLFNKDKMRVGDLLAGTWVIKAPKAQLMQDIVSAVTSPELGARFAFTPQQVDAYGIHELHVLEDVLRQSAPVVKQQVAARIRAKVGWDPGTGETDLAFLEAYYAALRKRLEQRMLLGERKSDKYDVGR
jgi:uncharacterized RDD family membrane protein YckC